MLAMTCLCRMRTGTVSKNICTIKAEQDLRKVCVMGQSEMGGLGRKWAIYRKTEGTYREIIMRERGRTQSSTQS